MVKNPFDCPQMENTSFFETGHRSSNRPTARIKTELNHLRDFVLQNGYPCVGAQASIRSRNVCMGVFDTMKDNTIPNLAYGLFEYIKSVNESQSQFLSYIAVFPEDEFATELAFERDLWTLLNGLYGLQKEYFDWDSDVSQNPANMEFSYSFGGEAFFIVGLHPNSSRRARRFHVPAIAFNLHSQFEQLREKGRYDSMKQAIRDNEKQFQGSINPMLADYGEGLEAAQYSGRKVASNWECPFKF